MYSKFNFFSVNNKSNLENSFLYNFIATDSGLEATGTECTYYTIAFDSVVTDTRWHRLVMESEHFKDAQLQIKVDIYTSNSKKLNPFFGSVDEGEFKDINNVDDYILKTNNNREEKKKNLDMVWRLWLSQPESCTYSNANDVLVNLTGRYLWLRITVNGAKDKDIVLEKLRIYFPRMSYLSYLPNAYQQEEESRDFLERFLSIFGSYFEDMEEQIDNVHKYFDVELVSGEYLKWMASWLAIPVDDNWSEAKLRLLIKQAPEIYKRRGTRQAIEKIVEIFTDEKPYIIEYFELKRLKDELAMKEIVEQLYDMTPYTFCVLVSSKCVKTPQQKMALQKLLDSEKPAYTEAKLIVLNQWIYLNAHTYLGVNTYLSEFTSMRLNSETSVLYNNVLTDGADNEENK